MAGQTELAILGALSVEPMTGYAMRQAIRETLGHFWSESFGQIYPTLSRLETERLIVPDSVGRTSGTTYRLTAQGKRRLVRLLRQPITDAPPRNGTLLRLFFGRLIDPQICVAIVQDARASSKARLEGLAAIRAAIEADSDPNAPYWLITVSAGEHAARAQIAWADETLSTLERMGANGKAT